MRVSRHFQPNPGQLANLTNRGKQRDTKHNVNRWQQIQSGSFVVHFLAYGHLKFLFPRIIILLVPREVPARAVILKIQIAVKDIFNADVRNSPCWDARGTSTIIYTDMDSLTS